MRVIVCDVCDQQDDVEKQYLQLSVPASFLEGDTEDTLLLDICSPGCLITAAKSMAGQTEAEPVKKSRPVYRPVRRSQLVDDGVPVSYEGEVTVDGRPEHP